MTERVQMAHLSGTPTEYLVVAGVLVGLVFLTLWRETVATNSALFFSRTMAALAFATSRVTVVVFAASMIDEPSGAPFLYILLDLGGATIYLS
ncbi:MAG: hypothetical protein L0Z51_00400, partial [Candidatus Latescibacteria bacterium]|nr:hypothetical protein [Candidatus Latescibacterota bacterium]